MASESKTIRAEHNPKFYRRFLYMSAGLFVFMGLCIKDGLYSWPAQHERWVAYQELVEENRGSEWEGLAEERGWPAEPPEKDRTDIEIKGQFGMAGACFLAGLGLVLYTWLPRGRWMESDGEKITSSWGQTVPYADVEQIDKKRWQKKGIAHVAYREGGKSKRFVIDDFKFERKPTDEMLAQMEQVVGEERIVNGPSEAATAAANEAVAAEEAPA